VVTASDWHGSSQFEGENMKKQYLSVLFTFICVLGLGLGAQAQEEDTVVAKIPYDFVVSGQVLPAGTYRVSRIDTTGSRELEISSYETRASALLIPTVFDDFQTGDAKLNFEHVGNKYFLSAIETPIGTYAITIPPSAIELARMEQHGTSSSGGH
jgi:hypothetical protein